MQVKGCPPRACQGPFVFVAPFVRAHHEYAYRSLFCTGIKAIVLQPAIEPVNFFAAQIDQRLGAKVNLAQI